MFNQRLSSFRSEAGICILCLNEEKELKWFLCPICKSMDNSREEGESWKGHQKWMHSLSLMPDPWLVRLMLMEIVNQEAKQWVCLTCRLEERLCLSIRKTYPNNSANLSVKMATIAVYRMLSLGSFVLINNPFVWDFVMQPSVSYALFIPDNSVSDKCLNSFSSLNIVLLKSSSKTFCWSLFVVEPSGTLDPPFISMFLWEVHFNFQLSLNFITYINWRICIHFNRGGKLPVLNLLNFGC